MDGIRNAAVTLYHRTYSEELRRDVWTATQFAKASWYAHTGAEIGTGGETAADHAVVRIYTTGPLPAAPGDLLAPCLTDTEITSPAQLKQLYPGSIKVLRVRDNRRGSPALQHWRLEGE